MSMKKNSPAAYNDVKRVMELALQRPGLKYVLKTPGRAVHFKQRCNRYRNMLRKMAQETAGDIPGYRAETAYDILVIRQQTKEGEPSRSGTVLVFDHEKAEGELIDPDTGERIDLDMGLPIVEGGE